MSKLKKLEPPRTYVPEHDVYITSVDDLYSIEKINELVDEINRLKENLNE